jgi:hypothetical protein
MDSALPGTAYTNWGWVLTPQPDYIPYDGSTITVWVNRVCLGHPIYNLYLQDVAEAFSGYSNSNGAVGHFYLNTTHYANGMHSIGWYAVDSNGEADGIGSRYFRIRNSRGGQMMVKNNEAGSLDLEKDELAALSQVINIPLNIEDILVSTAFAVNGKKIRVFESTAFGP